MKLLLSWHTFCVHHTTMHQFTVSLHFKPYTKRTCMFMCNLPPALLAEWHWDLLHAAVLTQGWNRYWDESQHRKCTLEKKMFMPHLPELEPATFQSWVWCSTTMPSPLPSVPLLNPRQHVQLFPHTCMHHHEITFAVLPTILAASFLQLQRCGYQ